LPSPLKGEGSKIAPPLRGGVGEGVKILNFTGVK